MAEIKVKMDKTAIIVSSVVGSLGLLSTIMGFAGIADPSSGLGICAGIFLLIAQITVSAAGGCCGCCASRAIPSETKRIVGIVCAVSSWVIAVIACILFFVGAGISGGMLAGGAVLTLVATALNITSVIMMQGQPANAAAAAPVVVPVKQHDPEVQVSMSIPAGQPNDQKYPTTQPEKNRQVPSSSPTAPLLRENRQVPQSPPSTTAQDNGTHYAQNQQSSPEGSSSADAARPSAADAPTEPVSQPVPRAVAMAQPQVLPPQEQTQPQQQPPPVSGTPQYASVQAPPQVIIMDIPGRISAASAGNGSALKTTVRNELAKATIRFTEKALEHALFSNNRTPTTGDVILNMMTADPTGADAGATDYYCGDSGAN